MKNFIKKFSTQGGQSLVELLIIMGLMALLLPVLVYALMATREGKAQQGQRMQAIALLKETEKALWGVRNDAWVNLATRSGTLHPVISGSKWDLASGAATTSGLTQQVEISDVYRNASGAIVTSGGTLDPSTKKADITISWTQPRASSIDSTFYISRTGNAVKLDTLQTDYSTGIASGVAVASTSGSTPADGHIQLNTGSGHGDWCSPTLSSNTLDLPGSGYASSIKALEGKAFVGTGENSSGLTYMGVNIANADPPVASFESTFDGHKTNDVFGEAGYAYVGTDTNSKEVVIIQVSSVPYTEAGYFNAPGNSAVESVSVANNVGYAIVGSTLYNFDLSSKSGSRPILDSNGVNLAGTGTKVIVNGNYAYVTITGASVELQIIDISNQTNLTVVGQLNLDAQGAQDVFVNSSGTRAYLATAVSATQREMFIVDTSNKSNPQLVGSGYEANGMNPKGISVVPGNLVILVGTGGEEYQVISIAAETSPIRCGGANLDAGINGISSVLESDGDAFSYIVTGDASTEFKIIQGGSGGSFTSSGTFESATFDAGASVMFNRFTATINQPSQTTLRMQVAVRAPVSGSCPTDSSSYTFVGPDGDGGAYFTPTAASISATFPFNTYSPNYQNPQRCFRYKTWFTTSDIYQTPILQDMTVNYSQ